MAPTEVKEDPQLSHEQLQDLTYPGFKFNKDPTLDENLLTDGLPTYSHARQPPKADLGVLDKLPLELLHEILAQLDIVTAVALRRANRRALELIESMPEHHAIAKSVPNLIRAFLSIGTGQQITYETLYKKLCMSPCEDCGDFGGYLYLVTCRRVCFLCFNGGKRYLPLRYSHAIRKFGLNRGIVNALPHMRSIPGKYTMSERRVRMRIPLVDFDRAFHAGVALHGSTDAMEKYVSDRAAQSLQIYNERSSQGATSISNRRFRRPPTKDPLDAMGGNTLRFMAIVRVPWLNRTSQELEWGFHCSGCRNYHDRPTHFRRKFTIASFNEHLRLSGNINDGKHHLI